MRRVFSLQAYAFVIAMLAVPLVRAPALQAQAATLNGVVTSESGQPLENANAFITELNISVATNTQGRYNIVIPAERVRNQTVMLRVRAIGHLATALLLGGFALYLAVRWWQRRQFMIRIRMARITPDELHQLLSSSTPPIVLDVRIPATRAREGWIPGSIAVTPTDEHNSDRSLQIVVYCDCPNDASAAVAARRLQERGFMHVRPLAGGFDSWRDRGLPIQGPLSS